MRLRVSGPARRDIASALDWSHDRHGAGARRRYERLIASALVALTASQDPPGSRALDEAGAGVRLYHLRNGRRAVDRPPVANPRHFLIYERPEADLVIVLRLLHDAMDLPSRLRDEE